MMVGPGGTALPPEPAEPRTWAAGGGPAGGGPAAGPWIRRRAAAPGSRRAPAPPLPQCVLFDRDGTLVEDVPYNGDPDLVRPMP